MLHYIKTCVDRFHAWQLRLETKRANDLIEWLKDNPPVAWKVYSTNSYNSPPAESVIVLARDYGEAIDKAYKMPASEWKTDSCDWSQDWGGTFAVRQ